MIMVIGGGDDVKEEDDNDGNDNDDDDDSIPLVRVLTCRMNVKFIPLSEQDYLLLHSLLFYWFFTSLFLYICLF